MAELFSNNRLEFIIVFCMNGLGTCVGSVLTGFLALFFFAPATALYYYSSMSSLALFFEPAAGMYYHRNLSSFFSRL